MIDRKDGDWGANNIGWRFLPLSVCVCQNILAGIHSILLGDRPFLEWCLVFSALPEVAAEGGFLSGLLVPKDIEPTALCLGVADCGCLWRWLCSSRRCLARNAPLSFGALALCFSPSLSQEGILSDELAWLFDNL